MWLGDEKLHGWSHTLWGALCIGLLTVPLSRPLINVVVYKWNANADTMDCKNGSNLFQLAGSML